MSRVSKIAIGSLLGFGLLLSLRTILALTMPPDCPIKHSGFFTGVDNCALARQQYQEEALVVFILMGMPSILLSGGILWQRHRNFHQQERDRLRSVFFKLLQDNSGDITTLQFAMEAGLEGELAKAYLDDRAREFNAGYDISEAGNIHYQFDLGDANRQFPPI